MFNPSAYFYAAALVFHVWDWWYDDDQDFFPEDDD